jgi:Domain of unknown function (DUF4261)
MNILRRILKTSRPKGPQRSVLAMPIFDSSVEPDFRACVAWARERFPSFRQVGEAEGDGSTFVFPVPGGQLGVTHIPAKIPPGDLEAPAALAWHWPQASAAVAAHTSHVICFGSSNELSCIELRMLHSQLIAALIERSGATGVYVGSSRLIREGAAFLQDVLEASPQDPPLFSWIGLNLTRDDAGALAYTTGLGDFELLDLEMSSSTRDAADLLQFISNIAQYEITSGIQIGDGETVGASADEKLRVTHGPSAVISGKTIARITDESPTVQ